MEQADIIIVSVFGVAWLAVLVIALILCCQVASLRKIVAEMTTTGRLRVQKLKLENGDKNHAFHNPTISPDEELSRRGYSMYTRDEDVESGRGTERQTGGQLVDELNREIDQRQVRQQERQQHQQQQELKHQERQQRTQEKPPPFLLQSIEENKRKSRTLVNPVANSASPGRQSETNPNFIY